MVATKRLTADDLWQLPNDGSRYELYWGAMRRMAPSGGWHSHVGAGFSIEAGGFVRNHGLGWVYGADAGFRLARDPDVVLGPDFAFIRTDRLPPIAEQQGYIDLAPDLVVEVISPGDSRREVTEKVALYQRFGVPLIWVADPGSRSVTVYALGHEPVVLRAGDTLDGGDVLPGFSWAIDDIFR